VPLRPESIAQQRVPAAPTRALPFSPTHDTMPRHSLPACLPLTTLPCAYLRTRRFAALPRRLPALPAAGMPPGGTSFCTRSGGAPRALRVCACDKLRSRHRCGALPFYIPALLRVWFTRSAALPHAATLRCRAAHLLHFTPRCLFAAYRCLSFARTKKEEGKKERK